MLKALVILGGVIGVALPAFSGEPRWYLVVLKGGESLIARLVEEEEGFYILNFQGSVLRVAKSGVRKFEPLAKSAVSLSEGTPRAARSSLDDVEDPGALPAAPEPPEIPPTREEERLEEELRDAIESLASPAEPAADRSYKKLAAEITTARPLVHVALRHQSHWVRTLSTKLLGEKGTAKEDLAMVVGRLADYKPGVRLAACMAVRALGPEGFQALVSYLKTETVPNNRKMAVKTFLHWKDPRAVPFLVERLSQESDKGVRGFIEVALEELTGQEFGQDHEAWTNYLLELKSQKETEQVSEAALPKVFANPEAHPENEARGTEEKADVEYQDDH